MAKRILYKGQEWEMDDTGRSKTSGKSKKCLGLKRKKLRETWLIFVREDGAIARFEINDFNLKVFRREIEIL